MRPWLGLLAFLLVTLVRAPTPWAREYACFSLRGAESRLRAAPAPAEEVANAGWLSRVLGAVVDPAGDLILVGRRDARYPAIRLDDVVVALRLVHQHGHATYPGLSIEPDPRDPDPWRQRVYYFGGIQNTRFGLVCLDADILLKRMSLGLLPSGSPGVVSVWDCNRSGHLVGEDGETGEASKTYFYPLGFTVSVLGNACFMQSDRIVVRAVTEKDATLDPCVAGMAAGVTRHFDEVASAYPVLEDLRNMMSLFAVAKAALECESQPALDYWMRDYEPAWVATKTHVETLARGRRGLARSHIAVGRVELQVDVDLLDAGDPVSLERAVLGSRPSRDALTWVFSTEDGRIVHAEDSTGAVRLDRLSVARLLAERGTSSGGLAGSEPVADGRSLGAARSDVLLPVGTRSTSTAGFDIVAEPSYVFGQLYAPDSLRETGYFDFAAVTTRLRGAVVARNRWRAFGSVSLDVRIQRALARKDNVSLSDSVQIPFLQDTHGVFVLGGPLEVGVEALLLDGMWDAPYALLSLALRQNPWNRGFVEAFPFRRGGYEVVAATLPEPDRGWSLTPTVLVEQPLALGTWLALRGTYSKSRGVDRGDQLALALNLRRLVASSGDGYQLTVGADYFEQLTRNTHSGSRDVSLHGSIEKARRGSAARFSLAMLLREPAPGEPWLQYVLASIEFSRKLFGKLGEL